jgi:hypothetical protein
MVSNPLLETLAMTGILLPGKLLELVASAVGDLLVGGAHLLGVDLATAELALGAVQSWNGVTNGVKFSSEFSRVKSKDDLPLSR